MSSIRLTFKLLLKRSLEISSAITKLKLGQAKGLDLISNEMLVSGQSKLLPCLVKLFNMCFLHGHYPPKWSKGYISPIFKSDDPGYPTNYRGITIISNLGKLFNSIINNRLKDFFISAQLNKSYTNRIHKICQDSRSLFYC